MQREQLRSLDQAVAEMTQALTELGKRVADAYTEWQRQPQAQPSLVFESVVTETEVDQMFQQQRQPVLQQALAGLQFDWTGQRLQLIYSGESDFGEADFWKIVSPEGVQRHVRYCATLWQHLDQQCSAKLAELIAKAQPWVSIAEAKTVPAERQIVLVGSETGPQCFTHPPAHVNIVATADKARVVCIVTHHGLDFFKLKITKACAEVYVQARLQGKLLHVVEEELLEPVLVELAEDEPMLKVLLPAQPTEPVVASDPLGVSATSGDQQTESVKELEADNVGP
jgi:hypothetical protein